jgi:hypothetical protein
MYKLWHVHVARKERRIIIIKQIIIIIRYKIQTWEKKSWLLSSVMVTGSVDCDGKNLWNDIQPQFVHTANQLIFVRGQNCMKLGGVIDICF